MKSINSQRDDDRHIYVYYVPTIMPFDITLVFAYYACLYAFYICTVLTNHILIGYFAEK